MLDLPTRERFVTEYDGLSDCSYKSFVSVRTPAQSQRAGRVRAQLRPLRASRLAISERPRQPVRLPRAVPETWARADPRARKTGLQPCQGQPLQVGPHARGGPRSSVPDPHNENARNEANPHRPVLTRSGCPLCKRSSRSQTRTTPVKGVSHEHRNRH
jgi:hypothetical protein